MRIKKICFTIVLICCSILFFAACKEDRIVKSISLNEYSAEMPLEVKMGNFSYSDYIVTITYDDGKTEELVLTEDMISETDKLKFYQEGKKSIAISYKGAETIIEVNVSRNQFADNIKLSDFTATYSGDVFTIEVEGDIPGGTKIIYPQGNEFKNAGAYDVTAILQCDGYETKVLSARVLIEKATYDLSNAQLYDDSAVYNKDAHQLTIKGKQIESNGSILHSPATLPEGVSVSYSIVKIKDGFGVDISLDKQHIVEGNKAIDAGTYKISAHFKGDDSNYKTIPDSVAYLTIDRATYDMSKVEFVDKTVTYTGKEFALSINDNSKLPIDVVVSYQIKQLKDGSGQSVVDTFKPNNTAINAGLYLIKACFSVNGKNAENYTTSFLEKEAFLTICRASYMDQMNDIYLDTQWQEFVENKTYEISLEGELPEGVIPQFTITSEDKEIIQGEMKKVISKVDGDETATKTTYKYLFSVENPGDYTCKVNFLYENKNFENIELELTTFFYIISVN